MRSMRALGCLLLLGLSVACSPEPDRTPSYLVGVWETQTEGYTDQHMFIDQGRIGFGTSAVAADGYVITKVDESREAGKTLFVLSYQDADQAKFQLAFFYEPAGGGRIIFKNQDHLTWTKKAAAT
ncbi:MAG: hypothetical protein H8K06_10700 [Nitrospira sp.]|uniref:hypothetical protein n=1 Tax=Nitrospira defluvii TaxID=330214 RepID=UPI001BB48558|nr:hypothetical protein [Nitrospira defluvii]MCS6327543.1 hypothetical protein [Nitrospira sp.]